MTVALSERGPFSVDKHTLTTGTAASRAFTLTNAEFIPSLPETVEVFVNGVKLQGTGSQVGTSPSGDEFYVDSATDPTTLTIESDSRLAAVTASSITSLGSGDLVVIRRISNRTTKNVDYAPGSVIREVDLDNSNIQILHVAQEAVDIALQGIVLDTDDEWEADSKVIKNVAAGSADNDAVNYGQFSPNITNIGIVAGISGHVTTVATDPVKANMATIVGLGTDGSQVTTVAGKEDEIGRLGTAPMAASIALIGTEAMADPDDGDIKLVADIEGDVTKVADIDDKVTIVAGLGTNGVDVSKVAAVDDEVTDLAAVDDEIALLGTEAMAHATTGHLARLGTSDMAHASTGHLAKLAATGVIDDIETVADIDDKVTTVAGLGTDGADVTTVADIDTEVVAVAGQITPTNNISTLSTNIGNINLIGDDLGGDYSNIFDGGAITDSDVTGDSGTSKVSTVAGSIDSVNTVATNIADVNNFALVYKISATAPETPTPTEGDLWYDSTNNVLKFHDGTSFTVAGEGDISSVTAGTGLTGGGATGDLTLNIDSTVATLSGEQTFTGTKTFTTPILGTPTSGTATNITGLPIIAGTTGTLSVARGGTGVTASSTGSGGVVLSTSPTLTTPDLGTPSAMMLDFGTLA